MDKFRWMAVGQAAVQAGLAETPELVAVAVVAVVAAVAALEHPDWRWLEGIRFLFEVVLWCLQVWWSSLSALQPHFALRSSSEISPGPEKKEKRH